MGKGDIKIKTKNGFVKTISKVLYVPDLKSNLMLISCNRKVKSSLLRRGSEKFMILQEELLQ